MPRLSWLTTLMRRLFHDAGAAVGVIFAVCLIMLVLAAGAAVDYTRAAQLRSTLQGVVDAAALSGASAYVSSSTATTAETVGKNYMNAGIKLLPPNLGITYKVTTNTVSSGGNVTAYTVTITASGQVATTLMGLITSALTVSVNATATNPIVMASIDLGTWSSSACDTNTIYWYVVPSDNSVPSDSDLHPIFTNATSSSTVKLLNDTSTLVSTLDAKNGAAGTSFQVPASQKIGFVLQNVTGGNCSYGSNQYGGATGSSHVFYSQLSPPSQDAYPQTNQNCSLQVLAVTGHSQPTPSGGSCSSTTSKNAAPSCSTLSGQTMAYFWNDMGGTKDDKDYNDAEYDFSCSGGSSGSTAVVLTQ